jgi:hypothetical protein
MLISALPAPLMLILYKTILMVLKSLAITI